jgi:hypothetical protein
MSRVIVAAVTLASAARSGAGKTELLEGDARHLDAS